MATLEESTLDNFIAAWNEPEGSSRHDLLSRCWAEDGKFYDGYVVLEGRTALDAHIGDLLRRWPDRRLENRGWLERMGGRAGFRWTMRSPEGSALSGYAFTEVDEGGLLSRLISFDEPGAQQAGAEQPEKALAKLRSWASENPLSVGSLLLLLIYLSLHFQAQRFYHTFGVSPEEVGFGHVELVVRQAAGILAEFVRLGLFWSVAYLGGMIPVAYLIGVRRALNRSDKRYLVAVVVVCSFLSALLVSAALAGEWLLALPGIGLIAAMSFLPRFLYGEAESERAEVRSRLFGWGKAVLLYGSLAYAAWMFFITGWFEASGDADAVKGGGWVMDGDFPWQARPVQVSWSGRAEPFDLPPCFRLVYLGSANGLAVLYDPARNSTLRVMQTDVNLSFPDPVRCLRPLPGDRDQRPNQG